jgi:hypothetical protein
MTVGRAIVGALAVVVIVGAFLVQKVIGTGIVISMWRDLNNGRDK